MTEHYNTLFVRNKSIIALLCSFELTPSLSSLPKSLQTSFLPISQDDGEDRVVRDVVFDGVIRVYLMGLEAMLIVLLIRGSLSMNDTGNRDY